MDFLKHRERSMVFYQVFLLYSEFEEIEISSQSCRGDCVIFRLLSGFRPRIQPLEEHVRVVRVGSLASVIRQTKKTDQSPYL
jgi:hypothetical protein